MVAPVVVGLDGSGRSLRALMWAAHNASMRGAPLQLLHVITVPELSFPFSRYEAAEDRGREILGEAKTLAGHAYPEVEITTEMPSGPTAPLPVDVSAAPVFLEKSDHAALIVLGAKGHDLGDTMLGSVALQVVGHARCPVVIVGHVPAGHRTVVVGTDGSPDARAALEYAFDEAAMRGYRLEVITAVGEPHHPPPGIELPDIDEPLAEVRAELKEQLDPLRARHPDVEVTEHVRPQKPIDALSDASLRADLLVVGSRGRGGFHGLALGSVSHKLLHQATCPIAVIRSPRA
jgi:nucleotide-binding universal stress UspA family protein